MNVFNKTTVCIEAIRALPTKTVVMDCPPLMTEVVDPDLQQTRLYRASRSAPVPAPPILPQATLRAQPCGLQRTRMVEKPSAPLSPGSLPAPRERARPSLPPEPPPALPPERSHRTTWRGMEGRGFVALAGLVGAAVFLAALVLLFRDSETSEAATVPEKPTLAAPSTAAVPVGEPPIEVTELADSEDAATGSEAEAAAMLLSGRRREALRLYRELARLPEASPEIEAMVIVLAQEIEE